MATSYNLYFADHSLGKRKVTQLILATMWKQVYIGYQTIYFDSYLVEKTLKDQLKDTLKELKIEISNQEGSKKSNTRM
jgi:hypothetical protein